MRGYTLGKLQQAEMSVTDTSAQLTRLNARVTGSVEKATETMSRPI